MGVAGGESASESGLEEMGKVGEMERASRVMLMREGTWVGRIWRRRGFEVGCWAEGGRKACAACMTVSDAIDAGPDERPLTWSANVKCTVSGFPIANNTPIVKN